MKIKYKDHTLIDISNIEEIKINYSEAVIKFFMNSMWGEVLIKWELDSLDELNSVWQNLLHIVNKHNNDICEIFYD